MGETRLIPNRHPKILRMYGNMMISLGSFFMSKGMKYCDRYEWEPEDD